jgi:hypothetical protein
MRFPLLRGTGLRTGLPVWCDALVLGLSLAVSLSGLVACNGSQSSEFPAGLEPIGPNPAAFPPADGTDPYPETYNLVSGETDAYSWAAVKGYLHAPITDVWTALKNPDAVVDRRKVNTWTTTWNVETGYDVSFMNDETVYDIITVEFQVTWRESHIAGTIDAPEKVAANYQKTNGSTVMQLLAGSVALTKIDDQTTAFECIEYIAAVIQASESVQSFQPDLYNSIKALSHGDPLPTY